MSTTARRILLYAVLVLALCAYSFVEGREAQATDQAVTYGRAVLGGHKGFLSLLRGDSVRLTLLGASEARFAASERYWRAAADSILADTLTQDSGGAQGHPQGLSPAVIALGRSLDACDASRAASDSARTILATDLALCKARNDTLSVALGRLLKVRAPRWGFSVGPALLVQPNGSVHVGLAVLWGGRW